MPIAPSFLAPKYWTVWTQLTYLFKWRTAIPLAPSPAPGWGEPTSRCRTPPSIWTLRRN